MTAGVSPKLFKDLVTYAQSLQKRFGGGIEKQRLAVLSKAEDEGFEGDEDALWAALLTAVPAVATVTGGASVSRSGGKTQDDAPKIPGAWTRQDQDLVTAPFRFVAINKEVAILDGHPQSLAEPAGTLSAVIKVSWAVETPLLIGEDGGNRASKPFQLGQDWAIPGATLRGAIRALIETVSFARLSQINGHRRFALRNFDHPHYKDFIQRGQHDANGLGGMRAGWLTIDGDGAKITPCDWGYVEIDNIRGQLEKATWIGTERDGKYRALGVTWQGRQAFGTTYTFGPARVDNNRRVFPRSDQGMPGHIVCSGKVPRGGAGAPNKRFEYVFFNQADAVPIRLHEAAWLEFLDNNSKPSANKQVPDGAWKDFAESFAKGGRVPVFFVGDLAHSGTDPDFSFGLTRLYRIPHKRSVGQVLLEGARKHRLAEMDVRDSKQTLIHKLDFAEHLFGFVHEPADLEKGHPTGKAEDYNPPAAISRKGRVAFGFATAPKSAFRLWPPQPIDTVMGTPKPSYAPFYLTGAVKDWSTPTAQLAGRKRYITRYQQGDTTGNLKSALASQLGEKQKDEQKTLLQFLEPATPAARFQGDIRLHNVSRDELGSILWALGFGGDAKARHLIGRAKAFGAGQIRADEVILHIRDNTENKVLDPVTWQPQTGASPVADYLDAFKARIATLTGQTVAQWEASDQVQGVLQTARPQGAKTDGTAYLPYTHPELTGQARAFAELRKKTGPHADKIKGARPPATLLPARKP